MSFARLRETVAALGGTQPRREGSARKNSEASTEDDCLGSCQECRNASLLAVRIEVSWRSKGGKDVVVDSRGEKYRCASSGRRTCSNHIRLRVG
jgi:hypothetical protein